MGKRKTLTGRECREDNNHAREQYRMDHERDDHDCRETICF